MPHRILEDLKYFNVDINIGLIFITHVHAHTYVHTPAYEDEKYLGAKVQDNLSLQRHINMIIDGHRLLINRNVNQLYG